MVLQMLSNGYFSSKTRTRYLPVFQLLAGNLALGSRKTHRVPSWNPVSASMADRPHSFFAVTPSDSSALWRSTSYEALPAFPPPQMIV
jgi:hypothetical protein